MKKFPSNKKLKEMEQILVKGGSLEVTDQCMLVLELSRIRREERLKKQKEATRAREIVRLAKEHNCRFIREKKK